MTYTMIEGNIDIGPLLKAQAVFLEFLAHANTKQEQAAVIQAFEFCFELSWKTMKKILKKKGTDVFSPKEAFRAAARENLIKDPKPWFDFLEMRNITVHTYNEETAAEILQKIPLFSKELEQFIHHIKP